MTYTCFPCDAVDDFEHRPHDLDNWRTTGDFSSISLAATIIPLLKPAKDPSLPKYFRPIDELFGQTRGVMAAFRLSDYRERHSPLSLIQSGFGRDIHSGFHHLKPHRRTVATLLLLSCTFDRLSHLQRFVVFRDLGPTPPTHVRLKKRMGLVAEATTGMLSG